MYKNMKTCYIIKLSPVRIAIADLDDNFGEGLRLTRINVPEPYRGKGVGSQLLKMIVDDADDKEVTLFLDIHPSGALNYEQLEQWYMRYGFELIGEIYVRKPIPTIF